MAKALVIILVQKKNRATFLCCMFFFFPSCQPRLKDAMDGKEPSPLLSCVSHEPPWRGGDNWNVVSSVAYYDFCCCSIFICFFNSLSHYSLDSVLYHSFLRKGQCLLLFALPLVFFSIKKLYKFKYVTHHSVRMNFYGWGGETAARKDLF